MILLTLSIVAGLLLAIELWRRPTFLRMLYYSERFPGPVTVPIIGCGYKFLFQSLADNFNLTHQYATTYGDTYRLWIAEKLYYFTSEPAVVENVLTNKASNNKGINYDVIHMWLGEGLLTSKTEKWQVRRKIITPAFHFKMLEQFMHVFDSQGRIMIQKLHKFSPDEKVDMHNIIRMFALDIICETAMGISVNAQENDQLPYIKAMKEVTHACMICTFSPIYNQNIVYKHSSLKRETDASLKILHEFTESVIRERRAFLATQPNRDAANTNEEDAENDVMGAKKKHTLLDILLHSHVDGEPLTDLDIREEVDTFMFEGHDTVASGLLFAVYCLACNPDVQQKCLDEIEQVLHDDEPPTISMLNSLPYLESVIKETLRMYPPVPAMSRHLDDDITIGGKVFPAGADVAIHVYNIGRSPSLHSEPNVFRPDRYDSETGENTGKDRTFASVPFSYGPRSCIGMKFAELEMKGALVKLIRQFYFELDPISQGPMTLRLALVLEPNETIYFRIKPRGVRG